MLTCEVPGVADAVKALLVEDAATELLARVQVAREDVGEMFELVFREERDQTALILAAHQRLLFGFVDANQFCVVRMPVGSSKCVEENTLVVDPKSGRRVPVRDVVNDPYFTHLQTWSKRRGVHVAPISAKHDTGSKRCLRLTTRAGRELIVTPEHPMLTPGGWLRADILVVGDTLASVGRSPEPIETQRMLDAEVFLLALLIAEGCTTVRASFSTGDRIMLSDARVHADSIGCDVHHLDAYDYNIVGRKWHSNPALDLIRRHGLFGHKSTEKRVPVAVFSLPNDQLAQFIATVWQCDGYVAPGPSIALANRGLIDDLAHLLLRFGIKSTVTEAPNNKAGAWRLSVRADSFEAFATHINLYGDKARRVRECLAKKRNPNIGLPRVRLDVRERVREIASGLPCVERGGRLRSWKDLVFTKGRVADSHRAASNEFEGFAKVHAPEFLWWYDDSIDWDEVVLIEDAGVRRVFDFTMDPTASFVANDLIAHNTFCMGALTVHLLGKDPTQRGAVVSATQGQAAKVVGMVANYIEDSQLSAPLRAVFPELRPSGRDQDPWTQTKLVVHRPPGIRDASLVALGVGTAVLGSRFGWILCDDILSQENTLTPDQRDKTNHFFDGSVLTRLDPGVDAKIVVTNTPWNQDDLTYRLAESGWPTVTMDIYGDIVFENTDLTDPQYAEVAALVRPHATKTDVWRLVEHGEDPGEEIPLWPERFPIEEIERRRKQYLPQQFAQAYLCKAFDDRSARCRQEWIDNCKDEGAGLDFVWSLSEAERIDLDPKAFVVTGVDLAAKKKSETSQTVIFTALVYSNGDMQPLWVDMGRFTSPEIRDKVIEHHDRYGSIVFVEDNGVQQWMLEMIGEKTIIPVWPFQTGMNKWHPAYGIESVFLLMSQRKWIIPNDAGKVRPEMKKWLDECRGFNPAGHTGDLLMASWFAKEGARVVRQNYQFFFDPDDEDEGGHLGVHLFGT